MNYKKVIEDYNNGTLNGDITTLVMDNDGGYWDVNTGDEDIDEQLEQELEDKYGAPNGYRDIVKVLCAAGVKADWC
ncbi:MAG: hypothetical protein GY861_13135 [bacterium]|nr:hypothetical protein [bacterium]